MTAVEKLFIDCIRSAVTGEKLECDPASDLSSENIAALFKLASGQDMAHLVSAALYSSGYDKYLPDGAFFTAQFNAVARYERIAAVTRELGELFASENISFILLKGSVLRNFYPEPWMRSSCDIDVLVKKNDLEKCTELLPLKLGYTFIDKNAHDVKYKTQNGTVLELHFELIEDEMRARGVLSRAWECAIPDKKSEYRLPDDVFYLYHIAHMSKHVLIGGCGVRPFLDIFIMKKCARYDIDSFAPVLEKAGLKQFSDAAVRLADAWFDGAPFDDATENFANFIIRSGIYGTMKSRVAIQQLYKGGKIKYALSRAFLPYGELVIYYPSLENKRWLTPVFEVARWFNILFTGGAKHSVKELELNSNITDDYSEKTAELLKQIGLI